MSAFLFISVPKSVAPELRVAFDKSISITDATNTPAGEVARGRPSWPVYLLGSGMYSEGLVSYGRDDVQKRGVRENLIEGIQSLKSHNNCMYVTLLLHYMSGEWVTEKVKPKGEKRILLKDLAQIITDMEDDVLYIIE